ncbi:MAG TPA: Stp1/IreP family PP2C-type Ser/Thr phosphatase [Vicinamibacteria bacterium]|nr:Stp1/IreP family PP2C-type Ser/Thr phosphatase [Vicinamibacteria bacterium]
MRIESRALTDVGRKRPLNEDSYCSNDQEGLYVVADGMGGHAHGEVASRIAVETIEEFVKLTSGDADVTWPYGIDETLSLNGNRLKTAIRFANQRLLEFSRTRADCEGMATTVVATLLGDGVAEIAHVGDSRLYLVRNGEIACLTSDHSWVNEQVLSGVIDSEQARTHPLRNVVTRALGGKPDLEVDVQSLSLDVDDRLLLCSDGLTTMLDDDEILEIVLGGDQGLSRANELVKAANESGGEDNITTILIRVN